MVGARPLVPHHRCQAPQSLNYMSHQLTAAGTEFPTITRSTHRHCLAPQPKPHQLGIPVQRTILHELCYLIDAL